MGRDILTQKGRRVISYRTFCLTLVDILQYLPLSDICTFLIQSFINMQKDTVFALQHTHTLSVFLLVGTGASHSKVRPSGDQLCGL